MKETYTSVAITISLIVSAICPLLGLPCLMLLAYLFDL